jgi:tryptophan synthase alpha chain
MSQHSSNGFIYLVASAMTTGGGTNITPSKSLSKEEVIRIRSAVGETPLMIGFGIKTQKDIAAVHEIANGAIIGSAYIKALSEGKEKSFISNVLAIEPQNP